MKKNFKSDRITDNYTYGNIHFFVFFLSLTVIYLVLTYLFNHLILDDKVFIRGLSDQVTHQTIEAALDVRERYNWLNYIFIPIILISKISFSTICISVGAVLSALEFKFKTVFKAALLAEMVFLFAHILYFFNLFQYLDTITIKTLPNYFPLSILNIYGAENVISWLHYPLQALNLFEVFYILFISWLLSQQWKPNFVESLNIVLPSYGTGLLLWLVLVTFLTLQVS